MNPTRQSSESSTDVPDLLSLSPCLGLFLGLVKALDNILLRLREVCEENVWFSLV
jgi:hypothetical protein